jgi:hypothetical protein
MYTYLDTIFTSRMRHAEQTDTRMAIRREEKQDARKRKDDGRERSGDNSLWEDSTDVSVTGLKAFLENILADNAAHRTGEDASDAPEHDDDTGKGGEPEGERDSEKETHTTHDDRRAARAQAAYQSTAKAVHDSNYEAPAAPEAGDRGDQAYTLDDEGRRAITDVIRKLDRLAAHNVETIHVEMGSRNFLQNLITAVDARMREAGLT